MEEIVKENKNSSYTYIIGTIYTSKDDYSFVESVLINNGIIIYCGKIEDTHELIQKLKIHNDDLKVIKLGQDQVALPGFVDSHVHPFLGGLAGMQLNISECETLEECFEIIKKYIVENPLEEWIRVIGYNDKIFTKENPISYKLLDSLSLDKPIIITRYDAHAYWLNSKAIEIIQLNNNTKSPPGGRIDLDINGVLNGVLTDSAMGLVVKYLPKLSEDLKRSILISSLEYLTSFGITSFMDAAVRQENFNFFKELYSDKEISFKLPRCALSITFRSLFIDPDQQEEDQYADFDTCLEKIGVFFNSHQLNDWSLDNKFKVNTVKLFIDGVFESGTALFRKINCPCTSNEDCNKKEESYTYSQIELTKIANYLFKNGIQMHCHCIGDIATKMVLNAIEGQDQNLEPPRKNYIAHLQLVDYSDILRMKKYGVYSSFSPYWFMADDFTKEFEEMIGEERKNDIYPINTLKELSVGNSFGSDWPISSLNPLDGIEVAVTHRGLALSPDKPTWNPSQTISVYDAVNYYTIGSATVLDLQNIVGSVEIGKRADLIILDKNIFKLNPWRIHSASVLFTMIDGIIVYDKSK